MKNDEEHLVRLCNEAFLPLVDSVFDRLSDENRLTGLEYDGADLLRSEIHATLQQTD